MSKTISTDVCIRSIKAGTSRKEVSVDKAPGLYLVVQPSGAKSFAIRYRRDGRNYKFTVGSYPSPVSLTVARDEARRIKDLLVQGLDPLSSTVTLDDYTFEAVFKEFMTRYCEKNNSASTIKATRSMVNTSVMPFWKDKDIRNLTKRDVIVLIDRLVDRGVPVQANRVLVLIKTFFKWCIDRDYLEASPAEKVQKPSMETSRDRVLTEDELSLIWRAADRIGFPYGTIAKALILSGQRKMEVGGASYAEFSTDNNLGTVWLIPKERCKNGREHLLALPPLLASVLDSAPRIAGSCDFIFTNDGERMVNAYGDGKKLIDAAMVAIQREEALKAGGDPDAVEVTPHWTFHDMRRTVASGMAALQVDPHVIEAVLNHASGTVSGVAAVYNRYSYQAEKRAALMKWETTVRRVCLGETNVTPLFRQAAE